MTGTQMPERQGAVIIGAALILLGAVALAAQLLGFDLGRVGWPTWIVAGGVVLFLLAFLVGGEGGIGLAILGGMIAMTGLILYWQEATGAWASWAYAWALIAPGAVGVAMILYGLAERRRDLVDGGLGAAAVGIGLFLVGALFFEGVLHLDAPELSGTEGVLLPGLVIGFGVLLMVGGLWRGRRRD